MDYAIGDIHGYLDKLQNLLPKFSYDLDLDRLIFLGDYLDRGPDSKGVLDLLIHLQRENPSNVFLRGNHEALFLDYLQGNTPQDLFLRNGGGPTLASYTPSGNTQPEIPSTHLEFLQKLPLYHEGPRHIFVHAGVRPGIPLAQQKNQDLLWIRDDFFQEPHGLGKIVVYGHTPRPQPRIEADKVGLDTGACFGPPKYGTLTAWCVQTRQIFQA